MVVAFEDAYKADEVLTTLKQLDVEAIVDLKSAAVVVRDATGRFGSGRPGTLTPNREP
jgi:uncharacterized membrane protein